MMLRLSLDAVMLRKAQLVQTIKVILTRFFDGITDVLGIHKLDAFNDRRKAREYYLDGLDELVFYETSRHQAISATSCWMWWSRKWPAKCLFRSLLAAGFAVSPTRQICVWPEAEKINVNSAAVARPNLINECSEAVGDQNIVLSMDVRRVQVSSAQPSGYEIVINGGRTPTGRDALEWALEGEKRGAGELVVNSMSVTVPEMAMTCR